MNTTKTLPTSQSNYEFHPHADLFPLLDAGALHELAADIKVNGLQIPILLYQDKIIDGRNRYLACTLASVTPRFETLDAKDDAAALVRVISLNLHRRHLTSEQKRDIIGRLVKADPTRSDRQVAADVKVDHKTVGAVRQGMEQRGEIPHVDKVDTKGRRVGDKPTAPEKPTYPADDFTAFDKIPASVAGRLVAAANADKQSVPQFIASKTNMQLGDLMKFAAGKLLTPELVGDWLLKFELKAPEPAKPAKPAAPERKEPPNRGDPDWTPEGELEVFGNDDMPTLLERNIPNVTEIPFWSEPSYCIHSEAIIYHPEKTRRLLAKISDLIIAFNDKYGRKEG